jgi:hypothetical protein
MVFGFGKRTSPNTAQNSARGSPNSARGSPNNKTLKNKMNASRKAALAQLNLYKSRASKMLTRKAGGKKNKSKSRSRRKN